MEIINSDDIKKFAPIAYLELATKEYPEQEWLIEKLIPAGGITIISGYPGSFKTWFMLDMAIRIAKGEKFLEVFNTTKNKVLYIDEENGERTLQKRIKALTKDKNIPLEFLPFQNFTLSRSDEIIDYCKENEIGLVIMDSLIRIHNFDENSSQDMAKLFKEFKKFKLNNISIVFSHHNRKTGKYNNPREDIRGSSEILAFLDCGLSLRNKNKNQITVYQTKLRTDTEREPFNITIEIEKETEKTKLIFDEELIEKISKPEIAKDLIIKLFSDKKELFRKEVFSLLKNKSIGESSIKEALKELLDDKKIESTPGGNGNTLLYKYVEN
ncbi:MAG: AAA family ATPase [Parcubacteria group bacterium]|jgi:RecA-family ATPase